MQHRPAVVVQMSQSQHRTQGRSLEGLHILLVEDESIIALMVEETLCELGGIVSYAGSVAEALAALQSHLPDAAVLDVNLAGEFVFPVAEALSAAQIPFVFTTGYGRSGIPPRWAGRPVLQKPFDDTALARALATALREDDQAQSRRA
jgi:CheY-like chemotaxis protein